MSRSLTLLATAALAGLFLSSTASAMVHCWDRAFAIDVLEKRYKERSVAHGFSLTGELVELFVSFPATKVVGNTWTITATSPRTKMLCLVSTGSMWNKIAAAADKAAR
jgi:hypothetical protein